MKIAICFSGMIREGPAAFPSIVNFIGDLWSQCNFFMHTWNIDHHNVMTGESAEHFGTVNKDLSLDTKKLETVSRLYNIKVLEVEDYWPTMGRVGGLFDNYIKGEQWIIPWFYSWHRSLLLKRNYEMAHKTSHDIVVKLRPDVIFNKDLKLKDYIDKLGENDFGINMVYHDNGVPVTDDIVFISNDKIAHKVGDWWIHRLVTGEYLNTDIGPFTQFYNFIKLRGANPVDLGMHYIGDNYKIGLLRQECSIFNPVKDFDKCVECDRLHYHYIDQDSLKHIGQEELETLREKTLAKRKTLPVNLK